MIDHGSVIAEGTAAELKARMGATVIEVAFRDDDQRDRRRGAARADREHRARRQGRAA